MAIARPSGFTLTGQGEFHGQWTGSLVVIIGIFSIFYLRPYPMDGVKNGSRKKARRLRPSRARVVEPKPLPVE